MTRTINPQDATRKEIMTRTVKVVTLCVTTMKSESEETNCIVHMLTAVKTSVMQSVPELIVNRLGQSLK